MPNKYELSSSLSSAPMRVEEASGTQSEYGTQAVSTLSLEESKYGLGDPPDRLSALSPSGRLRPKLSMLHAFSHIFLLAI